MNREEGNFMAVFTFGEIITKWFMICRMQVVHFGLPALDSKHGDLGYACRTQAAAGLFLDCLRLILNMMGFEC